MSICSIQGGRLDNVIPEECTIIGTLRALDDETASELRCAMDEMCQAVAALHRVKCSVEFAPGGYPATVNPASGVALAKEVMAQCGIECIDFTESSMASEDFSCYLNNSPDGVYVKLGAGEDAPPLHNCRFVADEKMIPHGIELMTGIALAALK